VNTRFRIKESFYINYKLIESKMERTLIQSLTGMLQAC